MPRLGTEARVMSEQLRFDADLIRRYDRPGPRYTSYPTALQFSDSFSEADYRVAVEHANAAHKNAALSLYVHIPFCTSPCLYCACTKIITRNRTMADNYLQRLDREMALQTALLGRERCVEQLHFGGGTPTFLSVDQLGILMDSLGRHFKLSEDESREFSIEVDPRTVNAETLGDLVSFGFNRVSLGVQDLDPMVQKAVNRIQPLKDTLDLIQEARRYGFRSVSVDLIYGLPLQTIPSWNMTLDAILAASPDRIAAYSYAHLPRLFKPQRHIDPQQLPSAEDKLKLLECTIRKLTGAGYVYVGMDHFARPDDELCVAQRNGTLQRNFQGYSTRGGLDLVGLGLSAISRMGDTYSQSAKTLNDYYGALDHGRLPLQRGVRLTADDHARRDVIEQLMCHDVIRYADIETRHHLCFAEYFKPELERLSEMQRDGLVECDANTIRVTPSGRLLLRAIAMVFDAYLKEPGTEIRHSKVI